MPSPPWSPEPPFAAAPRRAAPEPPPWRLRWRPPGPAWPTRRGGWPRVAEPVPAPFYHRDPREVAVDLLNKVLLYHDPVNGPVAGRIVEAEAYPAAGVHP